MSEYDYDHNWGPELLEAGFVPNSDPISLRGLIEQIISILGSGVGHEWGLASTAFFVGSGTPVGHVLPDGVGDIYVDDTTPALYQATGLANTNWAVIGGGGGPPSGAAGGDLGSTYPNPTVTKLNGTSLAALATGLLKNTTTTGVPSIAAAADVPTVAAGSTGPLSASDPTTTNSRAPNGSAGGDLTGSFPNPTLASAGTAGTTGDATHVAQITTDSKGRVTAASAVAITGTAPGGSAGGDLTGSYPSPTLAAAGPGATGPLGSAITTPVTTIDAKGRVTGLTSANIVRTSQYVIAATNSPAAWKNGADYVCTGTSSSFIDHTTINNAITALGGIGKILLAPGDYYTGNCIIPVNGVEIAGSGKNATIIHPGWALATYATVTGCTLNGTTTVTNAGGFSGVINQMAVTDTTTGAHVPAGTIVVSGAGTTTLIMSNACTAGTDTLTFQALANFPCIDIYDQTAGGTNPINNCHIHDIGFSYTGSTAVVGKTLSGVPGTGDRNLGGGGLGEAVYVGGNYNIVEDCSATGMVIAVNISPFNHTSGWLTQSADGAMTSCLGPGGTSGNPLPALPATVTVNCVLSGASTITQFGGGNFPASIVAGMALFDTTTPAHVTLPTTVVSGMGTATLTLSQATGTASDDAIAFQANQLVVSGTTQNWTANNVGDVVEVVGAGSGVASNCYGIITLVNSSKCVVLDAPALTTVGPTATVYTSQTKLGLGRAANNWVKNLDCYNCGWGVQCEATELSHIEGIRGMFAETGMSGGLAVTPAANGVWSAGGTTLTLVGGGNFSASIVANMALVDTTNFTAFPPGTLVVSGGGTATLTVSLPAATVSTVTVGDAIYFTNASGPAHAVYTDSVHGGEHLDDYVADISFWSPTGQGTTMKWGGWVGGTVTGLKARGCAGALSNATGAIRNVSLSQLNSYETLAYGLSMNGLEQGCIYSNMVFDMAPSVVTSLMPQMGGVYNRFSDIMVTTSFAADQTAQYCCSDQGAYNDIHGLTMVAKQGRNAGIRLFGAGGHNIWDVRGIHLSNLVLGTSNNQVRSRVNYDPSGSNDLVPSGELCTVSTGATVGGWPCYMPTDDVTNVTVSGAGTQTPDPTLAPTWIYNFTTTGAVTIANPAAYVYRGQKVRFVIKNNNSGTGALALTWGTAYEFLTPWVSPTTGQTTVIDFVAPVDTATIANVLIEVHRDAVAPPPILDAPTAIAVGTSAWYQMTANVAETTTATLSAGVMYVIPKFIAEQCTLEGFAINLTTFPGTVPVFRFGVYKDDGTGTSPLIGAALLDAGTVTPTAMGVFTVTGQTQVLQRGWYWFAVVLNSFTTTAPAVTVHTVGMANIVNTGATPSASTMSAPQNAYTQSSVTGALPSWTTAHHAASSLSPAIQIQLT